MILENTGKISKPTGHTVYCLKKVFDLYAKVETTKPSILFVKVNVQSQIDIFVVNSIDESNLI